MAIRYMNFAGVWRNEPAGRKAVNLQTVFLYQQGGVPSSGSERTIPRTPGVRQTRGHVLPVRDFTPRPGPD